MFSCSVAHSTHTLIMALPTHPSNLLLVRFKIGETQEGNDDHFLLPKVRAFLAGNLHTTGTSKMTMAVNTLANVLEGAIRG